MEMIIKNLQDYILLILKYVLFYFSDIPFFFINYYVFVTFTPGSILRHGINKFIQFKLKQVKLIKSTYIYTISK